MKLLVAFFAAGMLFGGLALLQDQANRRLSESRSSMEPDPGRSRASDDYGRAFDVAVSRREYDCAGSTMMSGASEAAFDAKSMAADCPVRADVVYRRAHITGDLSPRPAR